MKHLDSLASDIFILTLGIIMGAAIAALIFAIRPIKAKGLGLNVKDSTYSVWDYNTHQTIYSGKIPEIDSAVIQFQLSHH